MLVAFVIGAMVAHAQEQRPVAEDHFTVRHPNAMTRIIKVGIPRGVGIPPRFRACPLSFWATNDGWESRVSPECHPNLVPAVEEAAALWELTLDPAPRRNRELFEIWYLFPEKRKGQVRLMVRQAWDNELRVVPEWLEVLNFGVEARVFPQYPEAAVGTDTVVSRCDVRLRITPSGTPVDVQASRCDEVFHDMAERTLRGWQFRTPTIDDLPTDSAVTVGVHFVRDPEQPPGYGEVLLPAQPDLGNRTLSRLEAPLQVERTPPKLPTWPALYTMDHRSYAEVGIYAMEWPEPRTSEVGRSCDMLFQVNSKRQIWAWAETRCDPDVKEDSEEAGNRWNLKHGVIERGERFARFRGTFFFPANGNHVVLRIPEGDLQTPARKLPPYVETYRVAEAIRRVPPKLPRAFATEVLDSRVVCEYEVQVDKSGRPTELVSRGCPASYAPYAEKAVSKWRWLPAQANGQPIASSALVRVRFDQPDFGDVAQGG
ncbi:MAG: energy transducer TonB [Myxococcales bacterium]|nr:energy transducer TonB [Myxococcales bacterium]